MQGKSLPRGAAQCCLAMLGSPASTPSPLYFGPLTCVQQMLSNAAAPLGVRREKRLGKDSPKCLRRSGHKTMCEKCTRGHSMMFPDLQEIRDLCGTSARPKVAATNGRSPEGLGFEKRPPRPTQGAVRVDEGFSGPTVVLPALDIGRSARKLATAFGQHARFRPYVGRC